MLTLEIPSTSRLRLPVQSKFSSILLQGAGGFWPTWSPGNLKGCKRVYFPPAHGDDSCELQVRVERKRFESEGLQGVENTFADRLLAEDIANLSNVRRVNRIVGGSHLFDLVEPLEPTHQVDADSVCSERPIVTLFFPVPFTFNA